MVRRATHESQAFFRPPFDGAASRPQIFVRSRNLSPAIYWPRAGSGRERHQLPIGRIGRDVIQLRNRLRGLTEGRMGGHVPDLFSVQEDAAAVIFDGLKIIASGSKTERLGSLG